MTAASSSGRQPFAELREADQIREANRYLLGSGEAPGLELRPADRVVSELFTDVEPQDVLERHDQKRQECGRRLRVAPRRLELGVPLSQHGLADNGPIRGGELGGREAHDARRVVDLVRGEPRVEDAAQPAGGVEIVLGVGRLVGIGSGQAESLTLAPQELEVDPGELGDLPGRIAPPATLEQALDGEQRQPVLRDRSAELLQPDSIGGQLREQLEPCLAIPPPGSLEQALGFEVDRHAGDSPSTEGEPPPRMGAWREKASSCRSSSSPSSSCRASSCHSTSSRSATSA